MKNSPAEIENELTRLASVLNSDQDEELESKGRTPIQEHDISFSSSFLIEMVNFIKKTLSSINNINLLSINKYEDLEFRKYARKSIALDIKNIDSVLNALLNYININTPILKQNTIHLIIDDILEMSDKQIQEKNLKIVRKFEKDLPETYIHDEQVKFILNSIVQYLLLTIPSDATIGFLTKSKILQKPTGIEKVVTLKERQYVEILIVSTVQREPFEQLKDTSEILDVKKDQSTNLMLRLIKELIQKHPGVIEFEVDENKTRTLMSVRFPVERRQVILYEQVNL
jgi:nitrogen-specific signal transduction histidine kinase